MLNLRVLVDDVVNLLTDTKNFPPFAQPILVAQAETLLGDILYELNELGELAA